MPSHIDAPDDFFRVRLVSTLLDTCGVYIDHGSQRKKLDGFLTFFQVGHVLSVWCRLSLNAALQYYVLCKATPPMDVDYLLMDTFEVGEHLVQ